jgi:threonine aldolase
MEKHMISQAEKQRILSACTRFLTHDYPQTPRQVFQELAQTTDPALEADMYGRGELIEGFEKEIATLLGKEAAVFMPSGTMCQQIALRILTSRRGINTIAFHPTCHLETHEESAYQRLHHLNAMLTGNAHRLLTLDDLKAVREPIGALLLELPQREIGGQLPSWDALLQITTWARENDIPLHLDGARLWECKPFYNREYAEIAALFDTVYVSFYKVLGGIAGAVLAGPHDIIAESRLWQRRHGGNLIHLYPYVLSARQGLHKKLDRIELYCVKAREIAATLASFEDIEIVPNPPATNMMHLMLRAQSDALGAAVLEIASETGVWLFSPSAPQPTSLPSYQKIELTVGEATLDLTNKEIEDLFGRLLTKVGQK